MIESTSNSKIKHLVLLREKSRARNKERLFPVEGIKMFAEAPCERIREVYVSVSLWRQMEEICGKHKAMEAHPAESGGDKERTAMDAEAEAAGSGGKP